MQKINNKILSIPPYISTSWSSVKAIHMNQNILTVHLNDGAIVNVPHLDQETIQLIFTLHAKVMEESQNRTLPAFLPTPSLFPMAEKVRDIPIRFAISNLDDINLATQHNPTLANSPIIPEEILKKIVQITKMIAPQEGLVMGNAEPNCNCVHCQLSRAFGGEDKSLETKIEEKEEEVSEEDLKFSEWHIIKEREQLYTVVNKLDDTSRFNVFLGDPVGCTCGKSGCEHLIAVLKS
jgi:hypothetical protein